MVELSLSVLRIGLGVYAGLCLLVFFRQSRYVFYPVRGVEASPADIGLGYEDITISTPDSERVHAWYIPSDASNRYARYTILFCHGNAGNIGNRLSSIHTFHELGFNVLIFDYRGYGRSTGTPSEEGLYTDALAAYDWLVASKELGGEHIVMFGRSLGGAVAAHVATQRRTAMLVLESAFTSAPEMAAKTFPFLPSRLLCRFDFGTLDALSNLQGPVFVAHSMDDETVPYEHGKRLFEAAPEPKAFYELRGSHNAGGMDADPGCRDAFAAFAEQNLP